jgi:hypothetical protein
MVKISGAHKLNQQVTKDGFYSYQVGTSETTRATYFDAKEFHFNQ